MCTATPPGSLVQNTSTSLNRPLETRRVLTTSTMSADQLSPTSMPASGSTVSSTVFVLSSTTICLISADPTMSALIGPQPGLGSASFCSIFSTGGCGSGFRGGVCGGGGCGFGCCTGTGVRFGCCDGCCCG